MSAVGVALQIETLRTIIASLSPTTTSATTSTAFVRTGADFRVAQESGTRDRTFGVYLAKPPVLSGDVAHDAGQFVAGVIIDVRYDAKADHDALDRRIAEDTEQLQFRILSSTPAAGVQIALGGDPEILGGEDEGRHFRILRIPVNVTYVRTF